MAQLKKAERKKKGMIYPPELPGELAAGFPADTVRDGERYGGFAARDLDWTDATAEDMRLEEAMLTECTFGHINFRRAEFLDVRFTGCDFAAADMETPHVNRVEMIGCRMTGMRLREPRLEDLLVREGNGEYMILSGGTCTGVRFERCSLRGATFGGMDLRGVVFRECDLRTASFLGANLEGTDFRGCPIEGIQLDVNFLSGAIFDPDQALILAAMLGVEVLWEGE